MNRALIYLFTRSFWNSIVVRVKRLRQPKYLAGALVGGAYFYFYFYRFIFRGDFRGPRAMESGPVPFILSEDVRLNLAALGLLVAVIVFAWIVPSSRAALTFTEAEVAWLFPAPFSRAQLIRFRLIKSQLGLLLLALLMTVLTGRLARDGHALLHACGWWIVLMTLQLHRLAASFTIQRLTERGLSTTGRRVFAFVMALAIGGLLVYWARETPELPTWTDIVKHGALGSYIEEVVAVRPAQWLLLPFRWVVQPWFAPDGLSFLKSTAFAFGIISLHYFWVMRSEVAFEEASVHLSEKRAALLSAQRSGNFRFRVSPKLEQTPLFQLRPVGWPAVAFVWKSWVRLGGSRTFRMGILGATFCVVAASIPHLVPEWEKFSDLAMMAGIVTICALLFSGPQLTAQGLRRELQAVEWLKACPVPPSQIILGQLLGPALAWSAIEWVALIVALLGVPAKFPNPVVSSVIIAASALLFLPPFNVVASLVPSAVMLAFPGWFKPGESRGIEATGLGILMVFAQLLFLGLSLLPAALAMGGVTFAMRLVLPIVPSLAIGSIFATSTLAMEAWLGSVVLGGILARFDASAER